MENNSASTIHSIYLSARAEMEESLDSTVTGLYQKNKL